MHVCRTRTIQVCLDSSCFIILYEIFYATSAYADSHVYYDCGIFFDKLRCLEYDYFCVLYTFLGIRVHVRKVTMKDVV